ncbi:MAG TPA: Flp pilus assembly complex ATPase component TadA [Nanoarchaeota archaeon]|nr:Flp pilus assembly complex ATPase component TadA [Candidatus Woesearchaeota archaeon]HIH14668.1 Flp pilus assembly complex ATPase component TadA [Nanoarchaeota archaeon]HIH58711.1 Flp pilus assembly complex ATPase component TadA [Nanoarchaeota archaeon]HII14559.1 Flp pilus assembly complex ATPase component TadA [Nanoarchaeota archaeon]HIJ04879.1 Flp pilus assembly complex ATPase component TadA [Nanoarchaeota archaeon]
MQYVIDTSVVIEHAISKLIKEGKIEGTILLPKAVMAELENQANSGRDTGMIGLEEIQELQKLVKKNKIELKIIGERPNIYQMREAKRGGEIDSYIRDLAYTESAILITADRIQAESAKALDIEVLFIAKVETKEKLQIEQYFDAETMSVHLREACPPRAKKGKPGEWRLIDVNEKIFSQKDIQDMSKEIIERSRTEARAFIEISRPGSTIVQYKDYRIVITKTPVSDGWEITAVRPIKILKIEDYNLPEAVEERVRTKARGVIIAGTTGSGKSTIAQALAEYYASQNFITKTIESPRSLILSDNITQYSKNLASSEEIHDILFLSRPDYIVFDEMRDTPDFKLFTDLRLGGSNVLGVLHAATPIDAVQRFIGRLEMGMIPSVLDTLLFIDKGVVAQILTLKMSVKVPSGMVEADLARPVIEVKDLTTDKTIFEIYTYGEQTVVMPLQKEQSENPAQKLAKKQIEKVMQKYLDNFEIEMQGTHKVKIYVPQKDRARIIGTKGENINKIEKELGISIDIVNLEETSREEKTRLGYHVTERGNNILFKIDSPGKMVDVFIEDTFLFTSTTSKKGEIKVNKKSDLGRKLSYALEDKEKIYVKG